MRWDIQDTALIACNACGSMFNIPVETDSLICVKCALYRLEALAKVEDTPVASMGGDVFVCAIASVTFSLDAELAKTTPDHDTDDELDDADDELGDYDDVPPLGSVIASEDINSDDVNACPYDTLENIISDEYFTAEDLKFLASLKISI
jgi:hypothetical protein